MCYSIPMMGHALPVLSLARALAQRGHQVVYATSRAMQMEALCSKAGVSFRGLEDGPLGMVSRHFQAIFGRFCADLRVVEHGKVVDVL